MFKPILLDNSDYCNVLKHSLSDDLLPFSLNASNQLIYDSSSAGNLTSKYNILSSLASNSSLLDVWQPIFINNDNKNSYSNQHTASIEKIIKANNDIPGEIPSKQDTTAFGKYMDAVEVMLRQYNEYIKAKAGSDSNDAIYSKIKGKKGKIRLELLGKNVGKLFRVVIVCDTSCPIDTIKLPKHFAQILTVDETVTEYNFNRLQLIFNNGPNYPGYNEVTSIKNGKKYDSIKKE
jgi:hypothetical protein